MNKITTTGLAALLALFATGARAAQTAAQRAISGWPETNKHAALAMIDKYGKPDSIAADRLEWDNRGQFKRVAVEGTPGASGIVENTVSYDVPARAIGLLSLKDAVVVPDPEAGELTAYSGAEDSNVLALNVADGVMCGRLDAAQARDLQSRTIELKSSGKSEPSTERLQFRPGVDPMRDWVDTVQD